MKWMLICFCLLFQLSAFAQLQFASKVNDPADAKESTAAQKTDQLFAVCVKAMEHFAKELGYDYADFQKKLDDKFEKNFAAFKEQRLNERFGSGKETLTEEQKKEFFSEMEAQRISEYQKFSKILDVLQSYNMSKGEDGKTIVEVKMDRLKLNRLFKRVISDEKKTYTRLWILSDVTPSNFEWADLGLKEESSFTKPLVDSWQKWVNENLPDSVEDVAICDGACAVFYKQWEEKTVDEVTSSTTPDFKNSLWAKVSMNLRRIQFNASLNESTFEWDGKLVVLDVNTKRTLVNYNLSPEKKDWRNLDQKALNSALASRMYRTPLPFFKELDASLKKQNLNRVSRLVIKGQKNISDVLALVELMKSRGASLGLEVKLDKIRPQEAELLCFYQGEEKSFTDLLSNLKELKSSTSYQLVNEFNGVQHVLKLVN